MRLSRILITAIAMLLIACEANIETEILVSDILNKTKRDIVGSLFVEVTSCSSYEDSRKESSSLIEARNIIHSIFPYSEYIECFSRRFDSYARFSFPMVFESGKKISDKSKITIIENESNGSTREVAMIVPKNVRDRIADSRSNNRLVDFDFTSTIKIKNDTKSRKDLTVMYSYINGTPTFADKIALQPGKSIDIKLSDVAVDALMMNGYIPVVFHGDLPSK